MKWIASPGLLKAIGEAVGYKVVGVSQLSGIGCALEVPSYSGGWGGSSPGKGICKFGEMFLDYMR